MKSSNVIELKIKERNLLAKIFNWICIPTVILLFLFDTPTYADNDLPKGISCSFLMDHFRGGKSNQVSCTMFPEKAFSSSHYNYPRSEHCKVESTFSIHTLENFLIDFEKNLVTYKEVEYLSEYGKQEMINHWVGEGDTKEEAEEKVNIRKETFLAKNIDQVVVTRQRIFTDPVTEERIPWDEKRHQAFYHVFFDDRVFNMGEYVADSVISWFWTAGKTSYMRLRFGSCKILE